MHKRVCKVVMRINGGRGKSGQQGADGADDSPVVSLGFQDCDKNGERGK